MFEGLGNFANILKQAKEIEGRLSDVQDKLGRLRLEGRAGGEMVVVEASGHQKVLSVKLEKSLVESGDKELIEDLVLAATNQALEKAKTAAAEEMSRATNLQIPGLAEMMEKFGVGGNKGGPV